MSADDVFDGRRMGAATWAFQRCLAEQGPFPFASALVRGMQMKLWDQGFEQLPKLAAAVDPGKNIPVEE